MRFEFILPLPAAAGAAELVAAVFVSAGAAWLMLARAGRAGQLAPLRRMLGENASASWWKTTGTMA